MGFFQTIRAVSNLSAGLSAAETPVADPGPTPALASLIPTRAARHLVRGIPAVRKAEAVIAGPIATFGWRAWDEGGGGYPLSDRRLAWLITHHRARLLPWLIRKTVLDVIWDDRSIWRARRYLDGIIQSVERVHPSRITTENAALDPDVVAAWYIDGRRAVEEDLIIIDGAELGGLKRRSELLDLYLALQDAAHRYAQAPHPHAILKNSGADLTDDEIDTLLNAWEAARTTRAVGYLNSVVDYNTVGWNPEQMQLVESREYEALEVARMFGLSAFDLDARSGQTLTYANAVDRRRDRLETLRQWMAPIEAAVTHETNPIRVGFAVDSYTRDDPKARMETWAIAIDKQILTVDEVRRLEPLAQEN